MVIDDDKKTGKYPEIFSLFNGKYTISQIIEKIGYEFEDEVINIVNELKNQGIIYDRNIFYNNLDLTDLQKKKYDKIISYFNFFTKGPIDENEDSLVKSIIKKLIKSKILVVGGGLIGSNLINQLSLMGIGEICISDDSILNKKDQYYLPNIKQEDIGKPKAEYICLMKKHENKLNKITNIKEDEILDSVNKFDLIVVSTDGPNPNLYEKINKKAVEEKKIWTKITLDANKGIVGPTVYPHQTACYNCYELMLSSNSNIYEKYIEIKKNLINKSNYYKNFVGLPSFANILSGFLVSDIPYILIDSGNTFGKEYLFDFFVLGYTTNTYLKFPKCPTCGKK